MADIEDIFNQWAEAFSVFEDLNSGLTVFPTLLIPLGGNLEGMGTAYTAVASDSGFLEANPAASSLLLHPELSFLHHNWISDVSLEGIIYTFRKNDLGLGFGYKFMHTDFREIGAWGEAGASVLLSESIVTANISYNFLASQDFRGIAAGVNLKLGYRSIPEAAYTSQSNLSTQSALGAMADVGLLTRFNFLKFYYSSHENFSIGAVIRNLGFPVLDEPLPTMFSAGIAYTFIRPVTLAVDFNLPISLVAGTAASRWYLASGFNVTFTDFLSLQAGIRIKESFMISMGCTVDLMGQSIVVNYNLDLSGKLTPEDKFSVEAKIKLDYKERIKKWQQRDQLFSDAMDYYANGNYYKAIELLEEVIKIDPKFYLAQNYLHSTRSLLSNQERMEEKQQFSE